ncbi:MAG: anthranilate synthase component I family protein [Actinomycetota bacterium]|nr:anthranilate synthase component I family protein [Actinomycetota bacterium]MDH5224566.1 anthranilate synthase component I family protein [Actinomycetota bacterium]MDH5312833.1 anthranilate synthase component I family protein [Actinomycetota bacterium]
MELRIRPEREAFEALAATWPLVPVWAELLADVSTPVGLFPSLCGEGPGLLLESVERSERWGRYSFVAGDPAAVVVGDHDGLHVTDVRRELPISVGDGPVRQALIEVARSLRAPHLPDLPALTGGLMGYVAYEAAELLDGHPVPDPASAPVPPVALLVIDRAIVFDHWRQRLLLVAHVPAGGYDEGIAAVRDLADRAQTAILPALEPLPEGHAGIEGESNMSDERYREIVASFKEHILAGDIFQAVPSRRVAFPAPDGGSSIYRRLRVANPAPYMFFLRMMGIELAGSSPEPLVRVESGRVSTRPIAGTRPRGETEVRDRLFEHELLADPKEQAEHAMLVDLARNDIGRVCVAGSVEPTQLMEVERFTKVMHIVSTVEGDLREDMHPFDALAVTFPAGTLSGAPKRRAMELIASHEPDARGPYGGAVGYCTFQGDLDFCITIRTAVVKDGVAHLQAGAGVVADSDPQAELEETKAKASALLPAIAPAMPAAKVAGRDPQEAVR